MTKVTLFQKTIFPIIVIITCSIIQLCKPEALYLQKCYDAECSVQISKARTLSMYVSNHPSVLSFSIGEPVNVYSKGATDNYYWGVEIRGKRGLVPQRFLRESNVMHKNLSHVVPFPLKSPLFDHEKSNKSVKAENTQQKTDEKNAESTEKATGTFTESPEEKLAQTPDIQASPLQSVVDGTTLPIDYFSTQNIDASITYTDLPLTGIRPVVATSTESINLIPDQPPDKEQIGKLEEPKKGVNGASNDDEKLKEHHLEFTPPTTLFANGAEVSDTSSKNDANGDIQTPAVHKPLDNENIKEVVNTEEQSSAGDNKESTEYKTYVAAGINDSPQTSSVSEEIKVTKGANVPDKTTVAEDKSEGKDTVSIADDSNQHIGRKNLSADTLPVGDQNTLPIDGVISQSVAKADKADEAAIIDSETLEDNNTIPRSPVPIINETESINFPPDQPFDKEQSDNLEQPKKDANGVSSDDVKSKEHHVELMPAATQPTNGDQVSHTLSKNDTVADIQETPIPEPSDNENIKKEVNTKEQLTVGDNKENTEYKANIAASSNDSVQIPFVSEKVKDTVVPDDSDKIPLAKNKSKGKDEDKIVDNSKQHVGTESLSTDTTPVGVQNTLPIDEVVSQSVAKTDKADEAAKIDSKVLEDNNSREQLSTDNSNVNSLLQEGMNNTVRLVEDSISAIDKTANIQNQETIVDNDVNKENILLNNSALVDNDKVTTDILNEDNGENNLQNTEGLKQSNEDNVSSHPDKTSDTNIFFGNRNLLHVEEDVHKESESLLHTVTSITHEEHNVHETSEEEVSPQEEDKTQQSSNFPKLETTATEPAVKTDEITTEDDSTETDTVKQEIDTSSDNLSTDVPNEDINIEDPTQSVEHTPEYNIQETVPSLPPSSSDVCMADQECDSGAKDYSQEGLNEDGSAVIAMKKVTHRAYWETFLYVGISALTTLVFSLGYYYIENMRRDSQLIAKINKLEKDLLISTKECVALEETLKSTKNKLTSIEDESFGSNEMVLSLRADLDAAQNLKAELEDQNAMLERELENATEAGLELERMLREVLSSNNEVNPLAQSVEDLQARLNAQQAANESLINNLALKAEENESLSSELSALRKNYKDRETEVIRLTNELTNQTDLKNSLEEKLNDKIQRLEVQVKEFIAEKSALHKELKQKEEEAKDLLEVINQFNANNLDLEKLYNVSRIKAEASQLREERDELKVKLNMVEGAHLLLEEHMKVVKEEISALSDQCRAAEKEKKEAETRLEVLSNFFNEKEAQRQREEAIWLQKQGEVMSTVERIHTMQNEIESYKQQIEILKREIVDQEREYKGQISALETKVHEQWVVARQTERRLEESKVEAGQLRNRLTLIEKNMNDLDPEVKLHRLEANGETATSPALFIGAESSSSPIMFSGSSNVPPPPPSYMFGPPPLPPYLHPPPPSGSHVSPYDISQRPPPLGGRLSSPPPIPPPPLHPPPPPTSSSRSPPPPHGMFPPDHRGHHPSFPPPPPPPGSILAPPPGTSHPWGDETLPPLRNFGFHPNQQREQRPRNHKGSLHSSGESLDKSHHSGKV